MYRGPVCCPDGIRGYGNSEHGIIIVGQNPAFNEIQTGLPFTGQDGELLNAVLGACGWSRDKVYCTNSCCVFDLSRISTCRPRLLKEIQDLNPKLVITLGAVACENLFGIKISQCRGSLLYTNSSYRGLPTWLPSAILKADTPEQQNDYAAEFVRDIKKIARYFGPGRQPPQRVTIPHTVIYDPEEAQHILDTLPRNEIVTLDIETPIIDKDAKEADPYHQILCVGIGLKDDVQFIFPENILDKLHWPSDVLWGGWNLYGFDVVALRDRYNARIPVVHDGMLTSYIRDERTKYGTHKLKHSSREDAGADFYEADDIRGSLDNLYKYNGFDVAYNRRLLEYHLSTFDADDWKLYNELLIPAANMYSDAQYNGVKIDWMAWLDAKIELASMGSNLYIELVESARELGWPGDINPNSDQQVSKFFFEVLGIPTSLSHQTKGGKWSVDKNVLEAVNHPWAAKLRMHRQITDTESRYIDGVKRQLKHDGKIHPKCWIPGTTTGRPSYSDPPVQQLQHRRTVGERLARAVRGMFVPDSPDHILMAADYAQIELWMLYAFSGDENLYADLTEPWEFSGKPDYHSRTCAHGTPCPDHKSPSEGCPVCIRWEFDRDNQKHVNFGIPYGETAYGLMRPPPIGTGLPAKECQALIDKWYKRNPDVLAWQNSIEYLLRTTGFIKTPFGRKRRFPIVLSPKQIRQAVNAPIQGTASDYTLSSAIELWPLLDQYDSRLLWTTHDEILLNVNKKYQREVQELVQYVMEKPRVEGFPSVKTEIKVGNNLYEVSP